MQRYLPSILLSPVLVILGSTAWATLPSQAALSPEIEQALSQEEQTASTLLDVVEQDALASESIAEPAEEPQQVAAVGSFTPSRKSAGRCRSVIGMASWYGPGFQGRQTASGERFNTAALTAAHRTLPFNSNVRVTNLHNGRNVMVRINDRGPFVGGRVIDLSKAAARQIGMDGTSKVSLETCL
jgi:rare lipoprotein A